MKYAVWSLGPEPEDRELVALIDVGSQITVTYDPAWDGEEFLTPIKFKNQEIFPENGKYYVAALHAAFSGLSRIVVEVFNEV